MGAHALAEIVGKMLVVPVPSEASWGQREESHEQRPPVGPSQLTSQRNWTTTIFLLVAHETFFFKLLNASQTLSNTHNEEEILKYNTFPADAWALQGPPHHSSSLSHTPLLLPQHTPAAPSSAPGPATWQPKGPESKRANPASPASHSTIVESAPLGESSMRVAPRPQPHCPVAFPVVPES